MKRILLIAVAGLLVSSLATALTIDGSSHDLGSWDSNQRICVFCHVPHGGDPAAPLWNHTATTATYQVYSSSTLNATLSGTWATGSISKLCMSCHDNTIGLGDVQHGTLGGTITDPGTIGTAYAGTNANLGTDLRNDHPVAFTYQDSIDDGDNELQSSPTGTDVQLFNGNVECASCHDVHDNAVPPFLVGSNNNSAICLACHVK